MPVFEPSEREVILRIANDQEHWDVYVTSGSIGGNKIIKNMKILSEDENGIRGTLPRRAISIRNVKEGRVPKKKRNLTDEQRQEISERFKRYHASKNGGDAM